MYQITKIINQKRNYKMEKLIEAQQEINNSINLAKLLLLKQLPNIKFINRGKINKTRIQRAITLYEKVKKKN